MAMSYVRFDITGGLKQKILELGQVIAPEHLATKGVELEPHITVKYGLLTQDPAVVQAAIKDFGPVNVMLGELGIFHLCACRFDVLKLAIGGADIFRLNQHINKALPHKDTYPGFKPHITVAHVKTGAGTAYLTNRLAGQRVQFKELCFFSAKKECFDLSLV